MRRRPLLPLLLVVVAAAAGCGPDAPSDYTDEDRTNVLAACAAETDRPLIGDVCTCAYRSIRTEIPYDRFLEIDEQLRARPDDALPDDLLAVLAGCIIEVGEL